MELSPKVHTLIKEYQLWEKEKMHERDEGNAISVDEVAATVASFYEKIRGIVDWREEHLLRKTAIERILKRRIITNKRSEEFAEGFLQELVRGGHFPNNSLPLKKIDEIQRIVEKYVFISEHGRSTQSVSLGKIEDWLWSIATCEIEEALSLPRREKALIEFMYEELQTRIQIEDKKGPRGVPISNDERSLQVYIAVQRTLFKLDSATITYHIIEKFYADWSNPSQETLLNVSQDLARLYEKIRYALSHPYAEKFYQVAEKYDTPYLILGDIIAENPETFLQLTDNFSEFEETIKSIYEQRLLRLKGRIRRAAFYSTLSVFLTKILLALSIEIPVDQYLAHGLNYTALGTSVAIPPLLMLFLVISVQTSSQQNVNRVVTEVIRLTFLTQEQKEPYKIRALGKPRSSSVMAIVYGMYFSSFLLTFGGIAFILYSLEFSTLSILILVTFLSLVSFAGTRIRKRARELMMEVEKEGLFFGIFDFFALPMIQFGKWLSNQLVRYNLIVLLLNFLIEIPLQVFVEFLEQWRMFLKEKKEEIH
ncbi:MAG: hypothetical protein AAB567_00940 [Patescibacteria group bacterium]